MRSLLAVLFVGSAYPAWTVVSSSLRSHPGNLTTLWLAEQVALWFAGFVVPLALTLLPPRGHVMPEGRRALPPALLLAAIVAGAGIGERAAGHGPHSAPAAWWLDCLLGGMKLAAPAIAAGAFALRRIALVDSWRLGAALGVTAGSLASQTLHLVCGDLSPIHPAVVHGGLIIADAVIGTLAVPLAARIAQGPGG
jgi:hypothetical protein